MAKKPLPQQPTQPAGPSVVFRRCKLFNETWERHRSNLAVQKAFAEFVAFKQANPTQPFGSKDRRFTAGQMVDYVHAGLTFDISLIYKVSGRNPTVFRLYAIVTHDEAGTAGGGGGANNRQKSLAKRMGNQTFD